jgi:hypothetical protein
MAILTVAPERRVCALGDGPLGGRPDAPIN